MSDHPENLKFPQAAPAGDSDSPTGRLASTGMTFHEQILEVSRIAQTRLARMAHIDAGNCQTSYLFRAQHFCGIRFRANQFSALWLLDRTELQFFRGETPVGLVELDPQHRRAA